MILLHVDSVPDEVECLCEIHGLWDHELVGDVIVVDLQNTLHYCLFCKFFCLLFPDQVIVENYLQLVLLIESDILGCRSDRLDVVIYCLKSREGLVHQMEQVVIRDVANVPQANFHKLAEEADREVAEGV